jgi:predicted RNA-binding Zn-ribbon protein involved in translation (DUF1610 family)
MTRDTCDLVVMDRVEEELGKIAWELAQASQAQLDRTAREIAELEDELRQLKARLEGQLYAQTRLKTYRPKVGLTEYLCPNCWIVDGRSVLLRTIPFPRSSDDVMRCPACGRDFGISLRPTLMP